MEKRKSSTAFDTLTYRGYQQRELALLPRFAMVVAMKTQENRPLLLMVALLLCCTVK